MGIRGKRDEPRVFFPWERRRLARAPARYAAIVALGIAAFVGLWRHERNAADIRATRAEIDTADGAVGAWRADHDRTCPAGLADLVSAGYLHRLPRDAWGHSLRLTCPGRRDPAGFDLSSDGPDGVPGGLDRVE